MAGQRTPTRVASVEFTAEATLAGGQPAFTLVANAKPLEPSQLIDQSIAPPMVPNFLGGVKLPQLVPVARQDNALVTSCSTAC